MKPLIVIAGPTGVGKTELAHQIALKLNGEIISADSRQVYRYMDIGTAKPARFLCRELPYHLLDVVNPDESFTVADFKEKAEEVIAQIHARGKIPFLVGGTGLYVKVLTTGLFPSPSPSLTLRQELFQQATQFGSIYLYDKLIQIDKEKASQLNPNDTRRIIRALEVFEQTGIPISQLQKEKTKKVDYDLLMFCLNKDRPQLYHQINERVDKMIKQGLVDEVSNLLKMGYNENLISMEAVGYKQIIGYLKGKVNLNDAIETIKQQTRNFARRQLTWFKAEKRFIWLSPEDKDRIFEFIDSCYK
ncbi:MAG: tRNA (adenosine(37)-N6)-dimethylallyltransferase MiaA [bacterium]|nr:tRNA (adenosine(37)-N6)-dimethylallyltransferase MiaA [bacterium]